MSGLHEPSPSVKPYAASSLPIRTLDWPAHIERLGEANRQLARFDGLLQSLGNPHVLLSPLTTQEAVLSSRIEGTQATLGDVLQFEAQADLFAEPGQVNDITEVLNYRQALRIGEKTVAERGMDLVLVRELHQKLLDSVRGNEKQPGRFRTDQNWIGRPGSPIEQAHFVPPDPLRVPGLMANWLSYYRQSDKDILVQAAILHAQFEIIHPFDDGNGRLGRMLIPLFLFEKNLLARPYFYMSAYLERHREEYIARLRAIDGDRGWDDWVAFFLGAVAAEASSNAEKARNIHQLYDDLKERVLAATRSQFAVPLLDVLFANPVLSTTMIGQRLKGPSKPMVAVLIRQIKSADIVVTLRPSAGPNPEILALPSLINLCEGRQVL